MITGAQAHLEGYADGLAGRDPQKRPGLLAALAYDAGFTLGSMDRVAMLKREAVAWLGA